MCADDAVTGLPPEGNAHGIILESSVEFDEIAQFCSQCGTPKAAFDLFCGNCGKPLIRRFGVILPLELALFLGSGLILSLAHRGTLPNHFRYAPLIFLAQLVTLYLLRASLRQRRFLVLIAVYVALLLGATLGEPLPAILASFAPLYLGFGVVVLWITRRESRTWEYLQTLWVGLLIAGLSFAVFASANGILQSQVHPANQRLLQITGGLLSKYTPWFTLAGLCVTLAVQSGLCVARRGVFVREDYYPSARILLPRSTQAPNGPLLLLVLLLLAHACKRAGAAFYNALVSALNAITRSLVFTWRVIQSFIVALVQELAGSFTRITRFALLCLARIVLPLCAVYIAANASVGSVAIIEAHVFNATWLSAAHVLWLGFNLLAFTFVSVICFATISPSEYTENYIRDTGVVMGYGVPVFLLCSLALWLANLGTRRYLQVDLGFRPGQLSYVCLIILILGASFLARSHLLRMIARLRELAGSDSRDPGAGP